MELIIKSLFLFIMALVFAAIEVESEGKYGWAEKAPTWYRKTGFIPWLYGFAMGQKPLTGYHLFMFFVPIMIFHLHFIMGVKWTLAGELQSWAIYFAWCPLWDFLWFILNPNYGIKNFKKENIWWHAKSPWIFGLFPSDYFVGWLISLLFAFSSAYPTENYMIIISHAFMLGLFLIYIGLAIFLSPLYHRWCHWMRKKDDRDKVKIFHTSP